MKTKKDGNINQQQLIMTSDQEVELKYRSKKIYLDFIEDIPTFETIEFEGITINQEYLPNINYHGEYIITLSSFIKNTTELSLINEKIEAICKTLNSYSTYVIGQPLDTETRDFFGSAKYLKGVADINAWSNNYNKTKNQLILQENPGQKIFAEATIGPTIHWSKVQKSPMEDLLVFLTKRKSVNPLIHQLIYFHSQSMRHEFDIRYLILGKALEIAELFFDKKNGFKNLPKEIKNEFGDKTIGWLYEISNFRYETRHAINKKSTSNVHKNMTEIEYEQFANLSDLLLNYLVRKEFGLQPILWKR